MNTFNDNVIIGTLLCAIIGFAAWMTHIVWAIGKLAGDASVTTGQMVLAGIGAFIPPVGVIHGFMIWFGIGM